MPESVLSPAPVSATNGRRDSRSRASATGLGAGETVIGSSVRAARTRPEQPIGVPAGQQRVPQGGFTRTPDHEDAVALVFPAMRSDWVPLSASALVSGVMAMVFGSLLNPSEAGASTAETLRVVDE